MASPDHEVYTPRHEVPWSPMLWLLIRKYQWSVYLKIELTLFRCSFHMQHWPRPTIQIKKNFFLIFSSLCIAIHPCEMKNNQTITNFMEIKMWSFDLFQLVGKFLSYYYEKKISVQDWPMKGRIKNLFHHISICFMIFSNFFYEAKVG